MSIFKKNLIKLGFQCDKCGLIYNIDHPVGSFITGDKDSCEPHGNDTYKYRWALCLQNWHIFKVRGGWYNVRSPLIEKFLSMVEVEDGFAGSMVFPTPQEIRRQVDLYTVAEKLGVEPPLNEYQQKVAKTRAFVERIKK